MNWLGAIVARRCSRNDEVLDLGCGIMQATGGRLPVKRHVGLDCYKPYLDQIGPPTILDRLPGAVEKIWARSFDVVLLLDVIEHLEKSDAMAVMNRAEAIARREVIVFTPEGFCEQSGYDAWKLGGNDDQAHLSGFTVEDFSGMGYECERYANFAEQQGEIISIFATKRCD